MPSEPFTKLCVAGAGCFAGLALIIYGVPLTKEAEIITGVIVGGIGLANLVRFMSKSIASEINNGKRDSNEPG